MDKARRKLKLIDEMIKAHLLVNSVDSRDDQFNEMANWSDNSFVIMERLIKRAIEVSQQGKTIASANKWIVPAAPPEQKAPTKKVGDVKKKLSDQDRKRAIELLRSRERLTKKKIGS